MTAINGHRGARNLWPENSLPGFRNALQLGCDAIEFDVHLTDAGELVVIHDPLLDRTTDGTGPVRALTPETRRRTLLKDSDTVVPTLGEVLEVLAPVHGLGLHVEIKLDAAGLPYPGIAARVADVLIAHGLERRAHLTSFDVGTLRDCAAVAPSIARLVSADADWVARQGGLETFLATMGRLVDIVALRHDYLDAEWDAITALWPNERLCAWTVNDEERIRHFLDLGVGHLTSDRPDLALRLRSTEPA